MASQAEGTYSLSRRARRGESQPVHDISSFLQRHEPFVDLDPVQLEGIAGRVEIEFFARGAPIFEQGQQPAERVRMIRSGAVELVDQGRPLDLLGPGELFGHPSML